jgi:hypothetical protein
MKVKYSKIVRPKSDYIVPDSSRSFTLGKIYFVFGILFQPKDQPTMVTIRCDADETPALLELDCCSIVDSSIPNDWCFFDFRNGFYALRPKEFGGDFWDRFHDADPEAEETFEQAVKKLEAFHAQTASEDTK